MADDVRLALDALIRDHGEDYASISRLIGRNPAYIQQFIKRGTPQRLSEDDRAQLAAYFRVPEERLGGRPVEVPKLVPASSAGRIGDADLVLVPRVDVGASAGPGGIAEIEEQGPAIGFDAAMLRDMAASGVAGLSIIRVAGDSMEPTLRDGDDILVDRNDAAERLRDGIYVLRVDDMLIVKRLALLPGRARHFVIRSDNARYPDRSDYDPSTIQLIGRVLWSGGRIG